MNMKQETIFVEVFGKSDLYKLNTKNPAVQQLIKLDWNLIQGAEECIVRV
jgi:hypothetical protein